MLPLRIGGLLGCTEVPVPMFLKRVTLCGFKSFCDRVDFDFGPGVTCVVGPNGCGKSNLVDAFKWVLGEQSARSLRGRQMSDMIFNGSSTRRSSSVAQVDLLFDNADRALPFDHGEITVTRKLYRSGESEYLLNKETTRLKDIRELFMDTGIGVDAYSLIEQGKVDSLLQSSPTERRLIFEEAAGISKYKARKREAERKLERTQQNLLRVADIIEELEKRLRSVRYQAGKARRFKEYEVRLNDLRSSFALAEYHRLTGEVQRLTDEARARTDRATTIRTEIDRHEVEGSQVTLQLDRLAEEISTAENQLVQAKADQAAQGERIDSAQKRAQEQGALRGRSEERAAADAQRLQDAQTELEQVQRSAVALQEQTHRLQADIEHLHETDQSRARELTQAQAILEDEKAGIIDLLRKSAQTHNEIVRLNTHRESLLGQKGRLSQRDEQIAAELESHLEQRVELERHLSELEALIAAETEKLEEKKLKTAQTNSVRQQLDEELARAKERRSAMRSRQELLQDLERRMEGVGAGVRKIIDEKQRHDVNDLEFVAGLIADLFETDVAHVSIVEAALGDWDQYLVVTDTPRFLAYVEALGELPGRLTTLCLDRLPPIMNERDFSYQPGYVGRATELIRFPEEFEQLARHLLGKTVVVENLEAAMAMAADDVTGHRFVTVGGELVEPDGRIRLGPTASGAGLISRKSELRNLDAQMILVEERVDVLADRLNRTQAEVDHLDGVQQELRTAIYESNTARIEATAALQSIAEIIERLTNEQPLINREVALIEQQINEVREKSEEGGRSLEALERENEERERKVTLHQERIDGVVTARRQIQEQLTQTRVEVGQLTEKRAAAADRIHAIRRAMRALEESLNSARHDIAQCEARLAEAEETMATGRAQLSLLSRRIEDLEASATQLRNKRDELRLDMDGRAQAIKAARSQLAATEEELHDYQMALTEANVRRDDLVTRVREELGVDLTERYEQYEPTEQDWEQVEAEIAELRAKMDRLGNVNLDAIDELKELEERHAFLTGQRDDLDASHRQLEQLIARLNAESRERFRTAFEQIREHFRGMFRKLFGGGRADIILEDPDNILECGIEIVAQPPGKDLQVISLMSGGEKSMTAIALLMSIFKNRPAPFAFLDEVDAALDEANNDRFNRIVEEFVTESQFIIITHSKRTMNIADRLYGITMHEPGISSPVSVQLAGANVA